MKFTIPLLALLMVLAACQPTTQPTEVLPTVASLPGEASNTPAATETQTEAATITATSEATAEATEPIIEASATDTVVPSATATVTPRPVTATSTVEATQAAIGTATQAVLEAPRYATFTAAPAGTLPADTSMHQVADVSITEQQFQEEVNLRLLSSTSILSATVDLVPGSIVVAMTINGATPISGTVTIPVTLENNLASITISDITSDQQPVPQAFIDVATGDLFVMMVDTLDKIVTGRIGKEQKLKSIAVTDSSIDVLMLVP